MVGYRFNTIGVSDAISMGTDGMSFSLQSRDLIADSIETVRRRCTVTVQSRHFDAKDTAWISTLLPLNLLHLCSHQLLGLQGDEQHLVDALLIGRCACMMSYRSSSPEVARKQRQAIMSGSCTASQPASRRSKQGLEMICLSTRQ